MPPTCKDENNTNTTSIQIRQFQPKDLSEVIQIFSDGMMYYADASIPQYKVWTDYVENAVKTDLSDVQGAYITPGGNFWVAVAVKENENEEEVVGTVALIPKRPDGEGEIYRMSVKATHRRFGIGRQLLRHVEQWATQQGYTRLVLSNSITMTAAHKFYMDCGYAKTIITKLSLDPPFKVWNFVKYLDGIEGDK